MRIALCGAQSTGKSTIFNELNKHPFFSDFGYEFIDSPTRTVATKLNENGDEFNQDLILTETIKRAFHDHSVCDRCVLDTLAYTRYLCLNDKVSPEFYMYNMQCVIDIMPLYDYIFYFPPEFDIIDDGIRSNSIEYRDAIIKNFEYAIDEFSIPVIPVTGSIEERVQFILKVLGA